MGSFFSNFGHVLGAVISPPEPQKETKPPSKVRIEAKTLSDNGGGTGGGPAPGGGPGGGGPPGGPGGGVPPLSSTFRLLVILNFILIILLGGALIWLAVSGGDRPSVQTLITTLTNLLTGSVGTFVGLIGGKAA